MNSKQGQDMMGRLTAAVLLAALVLSPAVAAETPGSPGAKANIPADAAAYVQRRIACDHWAGEDPYDAARARQIAAAAKSLRCDAIDADETRLRRKYGRDPDVLKALDAAANPEG